MLLVKNGSIALNSLLMTILMVKVLWILSIFSQFFLKLYHPQYMNIAVETETILRNIFTLSIGMLLVYLYNHLTPRQVCIEGHPKLYLYSFGILAIIGSLQKTFHSYYFKDYKEFYKYL